MGEQQDLPLMQEFYAAFAGLAKLAEKQEAEQFEPGEFVAQGDKVVALGHYRWRIKSTGHSYPSDWAHNVKTNFATVLP
jgi:hypothetical protein